MRMLVRAVAAIGVVGAIVFGCVRTQYIYIHDGVRTGETRTEGQLELVAQGTPAVGEQQSLRWTWAAKGQWPKVSAGASPMVWLSLADPGGSAGSYRLDLTSAQARELLGVDSKAPATASATIKRPAGDFVIQRAQDATSGTITFTPSAAYVAEVEGITGHRPDAAEIVQLAISGPDIPYIRAMRQARDFSLKDLCSLHQYSVSPQYVATLAKAGYSFSANQLIELSRYSVGSDYAASLASAGYRFSSEKLIELSRYSVGSDYAAALRKAGYQFGAEQLIELSRYSISASFAAELKAAGCNYGVNELIELSRYSIGSNYIRRLREGGYKDLSINDYIELSRYSISADYAIGMRKAGYQFSVPDLIELSRYSVSVEFAAALHDPGLDDLKAQDLINLSRQGVDLQTLRRLRTPRATTQPA